MARGINKVILIGNLGDEPQCRSTQTGRSVANISLCTSERRRDPNTGEYVDYSDWHRVVLWGNLADVARQYLHKGAQVYIEGKLRSRSYQDQQGNKRYITEVVADDMQMLGSRMQNSGSVPPEMDAGSNPYGDNGSMPVSGGNRAAGSYNSQTGYSTQQRGGNGGYRSSYSQQQGGAQGSAYGNNNAYTQQRQQAPAGGMGMNNGGFNASSGYNSGMQQPRNNFGGLQGGAASQSQFGNNQPQGQGMPSQFGGNRAQASQPQFAGNASGQAGKAAPSEPNMDEDDDVPF